MSLPTHLTNSASQLPFYCSTHTLLFYLDDPSSFSQVLTIYNPYEFAVRYKVLCTAPQTYSIVEAEGEIRPKHSVDTVVRLLNTSPSSTNQNVIHKIRVQYFDRRKPKDSLGKRDVTCKILSYKPLEPIHDDEITKNTSSRTTISTNLSSQETRDPLVIIILTILGVICAFILILPTIPDTESTLETRIPSYLHMTTNAKIIASFVLGLLTVVFIRR